jgi:hypothetical protein
MTISLWRLSALFRAAESRIVLLLGADCRFYGGDEMAALSGLWDNSSSQGVSNPHSWNTDSEMSLTSCDGGFDGR